MKQLIAACALALPFLAGQAFAQASAPAPAAKTAQQEKMAACAKANKGKKGDEYKKAQSDCLSGKADAAPAAAAAPMTQQEKMAACAKANKGKKGDEYKKAQSACLSNKS